MKVFDLFLSGTNVHIGLFNDQSAFIADQEGLIGQIL